MEQRLSTRGEIALVRDGESIQSSTTRAAWIKRKETHGPSGTRRPYTKRRRERISQALRKTHCIRGHRLETGNLYLTPAGKRKCLACIRLRSRKSCASIGDRPFWVVIKGVRICVESHDAWCLAESGRLWTDVLESHPDRNGSEEQFRKARRRWDQFLAAEIAWYKVAGVTLPQGMKRRQL